MLRVSDVKEYLSIRWIKYLLWAILIAIAVTLIAIISNYLAVMFFHF